MAVRGDAVGALLAALLCCGTWPAVLQLAGAKRHSTLVYLDYSAAYACVGCVVFAASLPTNGGSPALAAVAILGGVALCGGNSRAPVF